MLTAPEHLWRGTLHTLSAQPVPVHSHLNSKSVLHHVQVELSGHKFLSYCLLSYCSAPPRQAWCISLALSLHILMDMDEVPSQFYLLEAEQAQLPLPLLIREILPQPAGSAKLLLMPKLINFFKKIIFFCIYSRTEHFSSVGTILLLTTFMKCSLGLHRNYKFHSSVANYSLFYVFPLS